jgi:uncharacterized protein YegP (UPF0339 family)
MLAIVTLLAVAASVAAKAQFQLFTGIDGKYYFRLRANNHEIVSCFRHPLLRKKQGAKKKN